MGNRISIVLLWILKLLHHIQVVYLFDSHAVTVTAWDKQIVTADNNWIIPGDIPRLSQVPYSCIASVLPIFFYQELVKLSKWQCWKFQIWNSFSIAEIQGEGLKTLFLYFHCFLLASNAIYILLIHTQYNFLGMCSSEYIYEVNIRQ